MEINDPRQVRGVSCDSTFRDSNLNGFVWTGATKLFFPSETCNVGCVFVPVHIRTCLIITTDSELIKQYHTKQDSYSEQCTWYQWSYNPQIGFCLMKLGDSV